MKDLGKGSVVNIGSFSWMISQGGMPGYTTAKSAIMGLTRTLARDLGVYNIRVNCITPSLTNSKIAEPMLKNKVLAEGIAKAHPLKRLGEVKDSASLAKFLITEDSS